MKRGFMAMMSKHKFSVRNRSEKHHPDLKKYGKFGPIWKCCWLFWLWRCNSFWISTSWLDGEWVMLSESNEKTGRGSEEKKAWFVEGENWLLHHDDAPENLSLLIHDFLTNHEAKLILQPPYLPDSAPADSFLFTIEIHTERMKIWVCWGDYRKFIGRAMQYFKSAFPGMLPKLEEMLRVM